ncbi:probable cytochrome P450 28d1 [Sabethes cyaneus]|uniref:probable cytochrome P450 28d1 n=1 Tax=Sabethes cyaneus TaxID=53552 RepID=UPI00237EA85F|nr:probable cytochrome P450 28d1 [Sabethes cyaneus]
MWWTLAAILAGLLAAVYLYLIWDFNRWKKAGIVGPKPRVLFGNLPSLLTQKEHIYYDMERIYNNFKGEPVVGLYSIRTPQLMIRDPELIKEVLSKSFNHFAANQFSDLVDEKSDPLFARNPFSLSGEKWKNRRAEITPAFTNNRIKALYTLIEEVCIRMTEYLNQKIKQNESPFDIKEIMAKYTTDVVSNCIFAIDAQSFKKDKPEIREMGRKIMEFNFSAQFAMIMLTFFPAIKRFYKFSFVRKEVEDFFIRIMTDAIRYRKQNNIVRNDYLDHLLTLEEKKQISEIDIAGHGVSFFADGFETSSLVMAYCLFDIASHPKVQEELRNEIRDFQKNRGGITYENLGEMTYLDQVLNESLRIHPIIPNLSKDCTKDIVLNGPKDKKIHVTTGTTVIIPFFVHLDAEYYDEPEKYKPERFSPENGGTKPYKEKGVFLPFGDGPRMCLGMRFALTQAKRGILEIIDKFDITVNPKTRVPLKFEPKMLMQYPIGGIWLDLEATKN